MQILLENYRSMKSFIKEFEEKGELLYRADMEGERAKRVFADETHADKTATAVIRHEIRTWRYNQYLIAVYGLEIACRSLHSDLSEVIEKRFFEGMKPMEAARATYTDKTTLRNKVASGIKEMTKNMVMFNLLVDIQWTF